VFKFDPQAYAYSMIVKCTSGVGAPAPATVPAGQPFSFTMTRLDFSQFTEFTCKGQVAPQDRTQPLTASWEVKVVVYDATYSQRERIYAGTKDGKDYLVLGQYARLAHVFDAGKWTMHKTDTIVELNGKSKDAKAYSESFAARFNYWNMSDQDAGMNP
jgi:hypothetical protein